MTLDVAFDMAVERVMWQPTRWHGMPNQYTFMWFENFCIAF